jgi:hypothetical protein
MSPDKLPDSVPAKTLGLLVTKNKNGFTPRRAQLRAVEA